jgi:predicted secreted hydrolase
MSRSSGTVALFVAAVLALGGAAYWLTASSGSEPMQASVAVAEAMGGDTTGYRRATEVRDFSFPADHGPHDGFKTEWWYLTGTLTSEAGRDYGFQWTLFRIALAPPSRRARRAGLAGGGGAGSDAPADSASAWATDHMFMGHFAVSDLAAERHYDFERFSREGAGLAGAQAQPFRVWLEDWSLAQTGTDPFPARLQAEQNGVRLDLTVTPAKPPVLQGDRGLSQKGPGAGNASYYYSYTRLRAEGTIVAGGDTARVEGTSWMDREWSTSGLGDDQVGWDWFALQLDDGRDLMYYQLRNADGSPSRFSEGVVVGPDGDATPIRREDVRLEVQDTWSPEDGARAYPVRWRLQVPEQDIDLQVQAAFPDQEMDVSVRYWEGAVRVGGSATGRGYVEMTGYGESSATPAR